MNLVDALRGHGYAAKLVQLEHLSDLEREIRLERRTDVHAAIYKFLDGFRFAVPESLPTAQSILVVAVPQPAAEVTFAWQGKEIPATMPPTYIWNETKGPFDALLNSLLTDKGICFAPAKLPLKLLAARCGLAQYGRNNISYIEGMGSYYRLSAYYTEMPPGADPWQEPELMAQCDNCQACAISCPTKCIDDGRFIIRAENCLTFMNELDDEFPAWVDPAWHNALIGCMICQEVCPKNAGLLPSRKRVVAFTEAETELILTHTKGSSVPEELLTKLKKIDLDSFAENLGRNLRPLLR